MKQADNLFQEMLDHYTLKKKLNHNLKKCLQNTLKDQLYDISIGLYTDTTEKSKKAELVDGVEKSLQMPNIMMFIVLNLNDAELSLVHRFWEERHVVNDFDIKDMLYLVRQGLVFGYEENGAVVYLMPEEIEDGLRQAMTIEMMELRPKLLSLDDYLKAAVNLYGVIHKDRLYELLLGYDIPLVKAIGSRDMVWDAITALSFRDRFYNVIGEEGEWLISSLFYESGFEDLMLDLMDVAPDLYIPESEEAFLEYEGKSFTLTGDVAERWRELLEYFGIDNGDRQEDCIGQLAYVAEFESAVDVYEVLSFTGVNLNAHADQIFRVEMLFTKLFNHKRQWILGGRTPVEAGCPREIGEMGFDEFEPEDEAFDLGDLESGFQLDPMGSNVFFHNDLSYNSEKGMPLGTLLGEMEKMELQVLADEFQIDYSLKANETDLRALLQVELPACYRERLYRMDSVQIGLMKKLTIKGGYIPVEELVEANSLRGFDLTEVFVTHLLMSMKENGSGKMLLVMPDEIVTLVKGFDQKELNRICRSNDQRIACLKGLCHLYGYLGTGEALQLVNNLLGDKLSEVEFETMMDLADAFHYEVSGIEDGWYWYMIEDEYQLMDRLEVCNLQGKAFPKMTVLKAADPEWYGKNRGTRELDEFYRLVFQMPKHIRQGAVSEQVDIFREGNDFDGYWNILLEEAQLKGSPIEEDYRQVLLDVYKTTPQWPLKGHSMINEPTQSNVISLATGKKVGRNDPCPCGSGKKYKHCCLNR